MKNHKITKNLTTTEAREKMGTDLEPLKMWEKNFNACLAKLQTIKTYIIKLATDF